jgi:hypothetical protein
LSDLNWAAVIDAPELSNYMLNFEPPLINRYISTLRWFDPDALAFYLSKGDSTLNKTVGPFWFPEQRRV